MFKLTAEQRAALEKAGTASHEAQRSQLEAVRTELKKAQTVRAKADMELKAAQARLEKERKANADKPSDESKAALEKATKEADEAGAALKHGDTAVTAGQKELTGVQKKLDEFLAAKQPGLGESVNGLAERLLGQARRDMDLFDTHDKAFLAAIDKAAPARKNAVESARKRLIQTGLGANRDGGRLEWTPIRLASTNLDQRMTPFEKQLMERFNASLLSELVLPGVLTVSTAPNFVDQRLFTAKSWRDIYQYDSKGNLSGWTRRDGERITEFTDEGLMVLAKDDEGKPTKAQTVTYRQQASKGPGQFAALEAAPGDEIVTYAYENGKRVEKSRTRAPMLK